MERCMSKVLVSFGFVMAVFMQHCYYYVDAQTVHVVGDASGWTVPQNGATYYQTWAANKKFVVGDILTFNFRTNAHDVLQVPKESYDKCSSDNPIGQTITTGPTNITVDSSGNLFFICTVGDHCQGGQKLSITVSVSPPGASPPSVNAPAPPPPPPFTTTAPPTAPSPTDACAPTPSSSPSPSSTPSSGSSPPPASSSSAVMAGVSLSFISVRCHGLLLLDFFREFHSYSLRYWL